MGNIVDISEVVLDVGLSSSITEEERAFCNAAIVRAEGAVKRHLRYDPVRRSRVEFYPMLDKSKPSQATVWEVNDVVAYQRQYSSGATNELMVRHLPIRSITNLWIDYDGRFGQQTGAFGAETLQTLGTDYWVSYEQQDDDGAGVCSDGIIRSQGLWPVTAGAVKIEYVAGFSQAELHGQKNLVDATPILEAVIDEAVRRILKLQSRKKRTRSGWSGGPITSESLGDYSYSVDSATMAKLVGSSNDLMHESIEKLEPYVNWGYELAG